VTGDLAADERILEDVHRLYQERLLDPEIGDHSGERRIPGEPRERRVEVVEGVADLVDRRRLGLPQLTAREKRLLSKKKRIWSPDVRK